MLPLGELTGEVSYESCEVGVAIEKEIFANERLTLHKWHSNIEAFGTESESSETSQSYAKEQLGVKPGETKLLGLAWNKVKNTIAVVFPNGVLAVTKKEMLRFLASMTHFYDPLGFASRISLVGKLLYRDMCGRRLPWDSAVPEEISIQRKKFENALPEKVEAVRCIAVLEEPIKELHLHAFDDNSGEGTSASVYHRPILDQGDWKL